MDEKLVSKLMVRNGAFLSVVEKLKQYLPSQRNPKIVICGEAPGYHENQLLRPFVGPSGRRLAEWWEEVGLKRSDFYITNVYPYQPPGNKIEAVCHVPE